MHPTMLPRVALALVPAVFLVAMSLLLPRGGGDVQAAVDSDGDGYDDALEAFLGTDAFDDCSIGADVGPSPAWPPDLDSSTMVPNSIDTISFTDITTFVAPIARFGTRTGDANYSVRWDLNGDGIVGALDVVQLGAPMFLSTCPSPYVPPTAAGSIAEIAIDMDTAGNDARLTLGENVQACGEIDSGGTNTIEIDVLIPSPGIHASDGLQAWEFLLNYDPAVVTVTGEDSSFLLVQAAGSSPNFTSDPLPDGGGSWRSSAFEPADAASDPEPTGVNEVGRGVLTRITLTGVAQGTSALTITKAGAMTGVNGNIPILTVTDATVSVDETCVPTAGDTDEDGVLDAVEDVCGSDKFDGGSVPERVDGIFSGVDDDENDGADEALPSGASGFDCDGDGYTGAAEDHVYSYIGQLDGDQKTCQEYDTDFTSVDPLQTATTPSLRWPSDFNSATTPLDSFNKITILDITSFLVPVKYFGTDLGTNPGDVRWDLTPGAGVFLTDINLQDLTAMIVGASGSPPMLGGVKAFGGPVCPWAP